MWNLLLKIENKLTKKDKIELFFILLLSSLSTFFSVNIFYLLNDVAEKMSILTLKDLKELYLTRLLIYSLFFLVLFIFSRKLYVKLQTIISERERKYYFEKGYGINMISTYSNVTSSIVFSVFLNITSNIIAVFIMAIFLIKMSIPLFIVSIITLITIGLIQISVIPNYEEVVENLVSKTEELEKRLFEIKENKLFINIFSLDNIYISTLKELSNSLFKKKKEYYFKEIRYDFILGLTNYFPIAIILLISSFFIYKKMLIIPTALIFLEVFNSLTDNISSIIEAFEIANQLKPILNKVDAEDTIIDELIKDSQLNSIKGSSTKILINSVEKLKMNEKYINNEFGYLPFNFIDNILLDSILTKNKIKLIEDILNITELTYLLNRNEIEYLSGGELNVLNILRVLTQDNEVKIFNHLTDELSEKNRNKIMNYIFLNIKDTCIFISNKNTFSEDILNEFEVILEKDGEVI